jgi:hypothetical protein
MNGEIGALIDKAKELDHVKKEREDVLAEINKLHKKISSC